MTANNCERARGNCPPLRPGPVTLGAPGRDPLQILNPVDDDGYAVDLAKQTLSV